MSASRLLQSALTVRTAADLWTLRTELLEVELPGEARTWGVLGEFHRFLDQLATSTSSRQYSELASKLDVAAVGGVALEHLLEDQNAGELAMRLLTGLISEGLMIAATRQHVKAWEGELAAVYRSAAWYLYEELWRWSEQRKPDLAGGERRRLVDAVIRPIRLSETDGFSKALLLGLLFQVLLVSHLSHELPQSILRT